MTDAAAALSRAGLDDLVAALISEGYSVIGPTMRDDAIVLAERTGPAPGPGYDPALTERTGPGSHLFIVEVGSPAGQRILDSLPAAGSRRSGKTSLTSA